MNGGRRFSHAFDAIFRSEGIEIVRTPIQAPNANAYAERWVGSARRECLDRLLIFGRRQLENVLRVYIRHSNQQRPHRALDLRPPDHGEATPALQETLRGGIRGAEWVLFDHSSHMPHVEEREPYMQVVGDWLARHD